MNLPGIVVSLMSLFVLIASVILLGVVLVFMWNLDEKDDEYRFENGTKFKEKR